MNFPNGWQNSYKIHQVYFCMVLFFSKYLEARTSTFIRDINTQNRVFELYKSCTQGVNRSQYFHVNLEIITLDQQSQEFSAKGQV